MLVRPKHQGSCSSVLHFLCPSLASPRFYSDYVRSRPQNTDSRFIRERPPAPKFTGSLASREEDASKSTRLFPFGKPKEASPEAVAGTMTARERELFSKIFQTIMEKKPSLQDDQKQSTISFTRSKDASDRPSDTDGRASEPAVAIGQEFINQYPASLQQELSQVQAMMKTKEERRELYRARTLPYYIDTRTALYSLKSLSEVMHFIQEKLFGPFVNGEIQLERLTPRMLEICRCYPLLISDVMSVLRLSFKNAAAAVSVFEQMRQISIESRAIGGSSAVYNELLLSRFEGWHDVRMMEEILTEMEEDAIAPDDQTLVILKHIRQSILAEREMSEAAQVYWSLAKPRHLEGLNKKIVSLEKTIST